MVVAPDLWLSEILDRPCFKVVLKNGLFPVHDQEELLNLLSHQDSPGFAYCKIPASFLPSVHALESLGFRLIDTNIVFEKKLSPNRDSSSQTDVQFAIPQDESAIVEFAGKVFHFSRFHLDPLIREESANRIKAEWARSYFLGKRGNWLVTAKSNGALAGFLLLLKDETGTLVIDLIGVAQKFQRKGIARHMISYAESHCEGVHKIRVGTQVVNIPSINLYENMGFRAVDVNYVLHYHHEN